MKRKMLLVFGIFLLLCFVFMACDNSTGGESTSTFILQSSAFKNNQRLAEKYCYTGVSGGQNISLPFSWTGAPDNTQSFALVLYDPEGGDWIHWAVFNIPPKCSSIPEKASGTANMPAGCVELTNDFGSPGYGGPEPPPGSGTHHYIATLYALNVDSIPGLSGNKSYQEITTLLAGKVIDKAIITGTYSR